MREKSEGSPAAHIGSPFITVVLKNVTEVASSRGYMRIKILAGRLLPTDSQKLIEFRE